jgi:spore coat protein CotH
MAMAVRCDSRAAASSRRRRRALFVHATLREGEKKVYEDVGVHLKGFYGSWRTLDQKPGFSVRMDKWKKGQRFHGLAKFNLNNSVADATFFNEFIGSEVFRAAGMAATLAAHAHLWINERDVGVYVLKEGFDKHFLIRNFADPEGNLHMTKRALTPRRLLKR